MYQTDRAMVIFFYKRNTCTVDSSQNGWNLPHIPQPRINAPFYCAENSDVLGCTANLDFLCHTSMPFVRLLQKDQHPYSFLHDVIYASPVIPVSLPVVIGGLHNKYHKR